MLLRLTVRVQPSAHWINIEPCHPPAGSAAAGTLFWRRGGYTNSMRRPQRHGWGVRAGPCGIHMLVRDHRTERVQELTDEECQT